MERTIGIRQIGVRASERGRSALHGPRGVALGLLSFFHVGGSDARRKGVPPLISGRDPYSEANRQGRVCGCNAPLMTGNRHVSRAFVEGRDGARRWRQYVATSARTSDRDLPVSGSISCETPSASMAER